MYSVECIFVDCVCYKRRARINYSRKFGNTLLVVFCMRDTSFTKLILKNGLSTTTLSKFSMLRTSKTLMSNRYVSKGSTWELPTLCVNISDSKPGVAALIPLAMVSKLAYQTWYRSSTLLQS